MIDSTKLLHRETGGEGKGGHLRKLHDCQTPEPGLQDCTLQGLEATVSLGNFKEVGRMLCARVLL